MPFNEVILQQPAASAKQLYALWVYLQSVGQ
jgi:hypothetical protein